jgi:hypothetical protein
MEKPNDEQLQVELACAFFSAARSELMQRLKMRQDTLIGYVVAVAALGSFIFKDGVGPSPTAMLLTVIPLLGICTAFLVTEHVLDAGALGQYAAMELPNCLPIALRSVVPWEQSLAFKDFRRVLGKIPALMEYSVLLVPQGIALLGVCAFAPIHWHGPWTSSSFDFTILGLDAAALIGTITLLLRVDRYLGRRRIIQFSRLTDGEIPPAPRRTVQE